MSLRQSVLRDEARRHCPIPASSYCFVDMENPVSCTIYLFNKAPAQLDLHKRIPV